MDKRGIIKFIVTLLIITFMVGISETLNDREIIFPEIAAIAVGAFIAPTFAWNTNYKRIFVLICISAVIGVLIVKFLPIPIAFQAVIAFALAQMIFINSGTSFAPMISAMVLPILLQTSSIVYIISAISLTLLILIIRFILEKSGISETISFKTAPLANKKHLPIKLNSYIIWRNNFNSCNLLWSSIRCCSAVSCCFYRNVKNQFKSNKITTKGICNYVSLRNYRSYCKIYIFNQISFTSTCSIRSDNNIHSLVNYAKDKIIYTTCRSYCNSCHAYSC